MTYLTYGRGGPRGRSDYENMGGAAPPRRPLPPGSMVPSNRQPGPPPLRPDQPRYAPDSRSRPMRPPPPPQQYTPPSPMTRPQENLYDGSGYGGAEYDEPDQWPLPARPFAHTPEGRSHSPSSPRRPPQRPQRPDYQEPVRDPPRPAARVAPPDRAYQQGPPPPQPGFHGSGQWTGDGYSPGAQPPPPLNPRRPPPPAQASPAPSPEYHTPLQTPQQAVYGQRNQRAPLGPPPSARRGPPSYFSQPASVHPIVEETDSMRGSVRTGSVSNVGNGAHDSYASSNAIPIGIPEYYLQPRERQRSDNSMTHSHSRERLPSDTSYASSQLRERDPYAQHRERYPSDPWRVSDSDYDYGEEQPEQHYDNGRDSRIDDRTTTATPSPEPAALIRQASLGKKSKPTLTTIGRGDSFRKNGKDDGLKKQQSQEQQPIVKSRNIPTPTPLEKEMDNLPGQFPDSDSSDDEEGHNFSARDKELEAGGVAAAAVAGADYFTAKQPPKDSVKPRSPGSVLSSGTGLLDPSDTEDENEAQKTRDRLGAISPRKQIQQQQQQQQQRSRARSPLAPAQDQRNDQVVSPLEKPSEGKRPSPGPNLIEPTPRPRKLKLDIDAVRDAEARGSLTSLSDLIKRATRVASNLDRGKTASRLGMNFLDAGSDSDQERYRNAYLNAGTGDERRKSSLSDILASFPPPGLATPTGSRGGDVRRGSLGNWSSGLRHSAMVLPSESDAAEVRKKKRRCCGMPLWLFVVLAVLVFLLIAAAVVVPVVLIVVV